MFLEMAHCFPEHCPPRAGGSQRDALGSLLCLRGWPLSTPSVWKDFGKQIQTQTLAGKACCVTSTCSKHHSPLKCLSNPRAALPGPAHHTKNSWMREMLKSFLWLSECHLLCRAAFALENHLPSQAFPSSQHPVQ